MDDTSPPPPPAKVPPVEPALLGSAVFLFAECLQRVADETIVDDEDDGIEDDEDEGASAINMREVLDLFAEELGTNVPITLNLYMRGTALFRLLAASPSLARLAADGGGGAKPCRESPLVGAPRPALRTHLSPSHLPAPLAPL